MEENNIKDTNKANEVNSKKENENKKQKDKEKNKPSFFSEHKAEFKKITWPSNKDLVKQTITVIIVSLFVATIIFGFDSVIGVGYDKLTSVVTSDNASETATEATTESGDNAELETEIISEDVSTETITETTTES